jgi:hypothetical protein
LTRQNVSLMPGQSLVLLDQFYSRLPMRFGKTGRLTLTNESPWPVCGLTWSLAWEPLPAGADRHARVGIRVGQHSTLGDDMPDG